MKKKLLVGAVLVLSGCSSLDKQSSFEITDNEIKALAAARDSKSANFAEYDSAYLSVTETTKKNDFLDTPMSFFSVAPLSIQEVLEVVEDRFNVPYYLTDLHDVSEKNTKIYKETKKVAFEGTIGEFFDYIGNLYGVVINVGENKVLDVSFYQTKVYSLDQFIDNTKASASLSVGGGEGAAAGFSASSEQTVESDTWEKISDYLDKTIGDDGTSTILEDFAIVNVKARPWVIKEIDKLFDKIKSESQMQVSVQYRVISLNQSKLDHLALNLGINKTGDNFTVTSDIVDLISSNASAAGVSFAKRSVSGRLDAIVQQIGQDVVSEGQFVGLPNRIMPINLTTTSSYISEIEKTDSDTIEKSTTAVKTAEIKTGLSMLILPKVLEDGRIQLMSGFTRKQLVGLAKVDGVQLPTVDENETLSTVTIDSGDVELITLYRGNANNSQKAAKLFGAGYEDALEDKVIAVLVGANSYKLDSIVSRK
ncbi:pilus assembly protein [Enterovibrio coralii]|uniref:Pilus assembly protein n=1 Tax=Enterovibrio coralii TaxID=294935 RepID=A0A135I5R3_9GAMM|nr:pilus assembly protein [Enterovibrio coralii]KXF80792.1 pilus assembly protein [Enterovibrio coralii]